MKSSLTDHDKRVLSEYKAFEASLPRLLRRHRGRWVVFYKGQVKSVHDDERSALAAGARDPGPDAAFLVVAVRKAVPIQVGPAIRMTSQ